MNMVQYIHLGSSRFNYMRAGQKTIGNRGTSSVECLHLCKNPKIVYQDAHLSVKPGFTRL